MKNEFLTHSEIDRLFGPIDDHRALEILDLKPTRNDLEVAQAYLADMNDVLGDERQPLSGVVASLVEIVTRDEPLDEA